MANIFGTIETEERIVEICIPLFIRIATLLGGPNNICAAEKDRDRRRRRAIMRVILYFVYLNLRNICLDIIINKN